MKKFFDFIQLPNFDIAADAAATFKVVGLTRILTDVHLYLLKFLFFPVVNMALVQQPYRFLVKVNCAFPSQIQKVKLVKQCFVNMLSLFKFYLSVELGCSVWMKVGERGYLD